VLHASQSEKLGPGGISPAPNPPSAQEALACWPRCLSSEAVIMLPKSMSITRCGPSSRDFSSRCLCWAASSWRCLRVS
jgi:hypothetical protein